MTNYQKLAQQVAKMCHDTPIPVSVLAVKLEEVMNDAIAMGNNPIEALCSFTGIDRKYIDNLYY